MRASQYLIATQKETPADAVVISHKLMLRAGIIRKSASGLYSWLPTGLRVLRKIEAIVREEMNSAGAQEVLMPVVQPSTLWQESGRWEQFGPELTRFKDRHDNSFCLGPTHEEVITDLVRNEITSYKQLPANFYQIQTKFRDEVRPRFGCMRAREFLMKDAYSFHVDEQSLLETYEIMYKAYSNIFDRIGLDYRAVLADTGSIGGSGSHEFHVLADSGEDDIVFSTESDYAANIEMAEALAPIKSDQPPAQSHILVETPHKKTITDVTAFLQLQESQALKTLFVLGVACENGKQPLIALVLRGDHELNEVKAEKLSEIASPLTFADEQRIEQELGAKVGSLGPVGLDDSNINVIADRAAASTINFACGANKTGFHYTDVNWGIDAHFNQVADLRNLKRGDASPDGKGTVEIKRGIEVGHIFQLGDKYAKAMNASVQGPTGQNTVMTMGCYGIGVSRVVAAAIEQNYDDKGIIWPHSIAPFDLAIVPINYHKSDRVKQKSEKLYQSLKKQGIDVLLMDEPKARLGAMLADIELVGIPHRLVIGEKGLDKGLIEYRSRRADTGEDITAEDIESFLLNTIKQS